jgi:Xaa-Pro aminopeptidase
MAMKSGVIARDVDAIMRRGALDTGLRPTYENVTAYTLGLYTRTPRTSDFSRVLLPTSDWPLEEGKVFSPSCDSSRPGFQRNGGRRYHVHGRLFAFVEEARGVGQLVRDPELGSLRNA